MRIHTVISAALIITTASGCELFTGQVEDAIADAQQQQQSPQQVDCTDPADNPYAGTCVESFLADCFDPSGACVGEVSQAGVDLTWDNGAEVLNTIDYSDPYSPRTTTELSSSGGAMCATGLTETHALDQTAECYSTTTYTRASDGQRLTFCVRTDTSMKVTCDDGSTFEVDGQAAHGASLCQYGNEAGACEVEVSDDFGYQG